MKTKYLVLATFDPCEFENESEAIDYATNVSKHEAYIDEDIKIIKIEETTIKTFRNGGEVA